MMVEIPDVAFTSRFRLLLSANVGWVGCSGCAVSSIRCSITQASWMTLSGLRDYSLFWWTCVAALQSFWNMALHAWQFQVLSASPYMVVI